MYTFVQIFFIISFASYGQFVTVNELVREEWNAFKLTHKKNYANPIEDSLRMKIFMETSYKIARHNQRHELGLVPYQVELNKFADLLNHEFVKTYNGFNNTLRKIYKNEKLGTTFIPPAHVTVPDTVDWRLEGAVTPVKDQASCGSCWSFSSTGSLEGQHFRKTGKLISLSEQNLIDCTISYGNNGCGGGYMDNSFRYIKDNHGIDTEKSYPYEGEDDQCKYNPSNSGAEDTGFVDLPEGDEDKLKIAVATIGPIAVAMDASHSSFRYYQKGIYYEPKCSSDELDHAVLVVGYGSEDSQDYWLVKNSWSDTWGEEGYIKIARNKNNHCGIATSASYPLV